MPGTKYQAGHSDLLIGSISANKDAWPALKLLHKNLGIQAGTEEIWLTLAGCARWACGWSATSRARSRSRAG